MAILKSINLRMSVRTKFFHAHSMQKLIVFYFKRKIWEPFFFIFRTNSQGLFNGHLNCLIWMHMKSWPEWFWICFAIGLNLFVKVMITIDTLTIMAKMWKSYFTIIIDIFIWCEYFINWLKIKSLCQCIRLELVGRNNCDELSTVTVIIYSFVHRPIKFVPTKKKIRIETTKQKERRGTGKKNTWLRFQYIYHGRYFRFNRYFIVDMVWPVLHQPKMHCNIIYQFHGTFIFLKNKNVNVQFRTMHWMSYNAKSLHIDHRDLFAEYTKPNGQFLTFLIENRRFLQFTCFSRARSQKQ